MASYRNNTAKKNKMWWITILLVAIFAYGLGLITGNYHIFPYRQIKNLKNVLDAGSAYADKKKIYKHYYLAKKSFFEVDGSKANIVMIGDSITDHGEWNELFPKISIVNRGIGGDTTKGVLNRMESIYSTKAKKAFIMIGVNDLGKHISIDEIVSNYRKIVFKLKQHGITPYIQSTLFVGDKRAYKNKDIMKLNLKLKKLSEKENIVFIDLNKVLSENGTLKKSYSSEDDIHLNGDGYNVWKNNLKKYIK